MIWVLVIIVVTAIYYAERLPQIMNKVKDELKTISNQINEATSSYKEQHAELSKLKGDYDTSNEDSMISKYRELSKGVSGYGENLSLTTDEYAEYQSIVDQIIDTNPDLIAGYNSQGKAILKNAGDVDALAESYKNLIKEQNKEVLTGKDEDGNFKDRFENAKDTIRDFNNDIRKTSAWYQTQEQDGEGVVSYVENYSTKHLDTLKRLMGLNGDNLKEEIEALTFEEQNQIATLLESSGIERDKWLSDAAGDGLFNSELTSEYINRAITNNVKGNALLNICSGLISTVIVLILLATTNFELVEPISSVNSSLTILTICCAGRRLSRTSLPTARSVTD